ncbi:P-loop containing nucleoside triphosphate hydrolase protein [Flagelloscypha sp. PMI_526]|nr:P-loop containing nucleoside triphosphate hydrolase protein [Flagelloscypha sp. PMI_526]
MIQIRPSPIISLICHLSISLPSPKLSQQPFHSLRLDLDPLNSESCANEKFSSIPRTELLCGLSVDKIPEAQSTPTHKPIECLSEALDHLKLDVQESPFENPRTSRRALHDYQKYDVDFYERNEIAFELKTGHANGSLVCLDMGCGKTAEALALVGRRSRTFMQQLLPDPKVADVTLVVLPSDVMSSWKREINLWLPGVQTMILHRNYSVHGANQDFRQSKIVLASYHQVISQYGWKLDDERYHSQQMAERGLSVGASESRKIYEQHLATLPWDHQEFFPLFRFKFLRIILDEAHLMRNPETVTFKAVMALQKIFGLVLTGTPAQNSTTDVETLLQFLGCTSSLLVESNLSLITSRRTKEAVLDKLGPRYDRIHRVTLTSSEMELYNLVYSMHRGSPLLRQLRSRQAAVHPSLMKEPLFSANDFGKKKSREQQEKEFLLEAICYQFAMNNGVELESIQNRIKFLDSEKELPPEFAPYEPLLHGTYISSKVAYAINLVQSADGKCIIFSNFVMALDLVAIALKKHEINFVTYFGRNKMNERTKALERLEQDSSCRVILVSLKAGGVGVSMISANTVIILDPWWNPYAESQAISRAHRMSQARPVFVHRLIAVETIDEEKIEPVQDRKRAEIEPWMKKLEEATKMRDLENKTKVKKESTPSYLPKF